MAKLALSLLFLSLFVLTSTASEDIAGGASETRSASPNSRGAVRVLPAEIPRSWQRRRSPSTQQSPRSPANLISNPNKKEIDIKETPPNAEQSPKDIAANLDARREKELIASPPLRKNETNADSSEEVVDKDAQPSKSVNASKYDNTHKSLQAPVKVFSESGMVHDAQSVKIQQGRSSPRTNSKLSGVDRKENGSLDVQNRNFNEVSPRDISEEAPLKLTSNTRILEQKSNGSASEESSEASLGESSEENISDRATAKELIAEAQNFQSTEETSTDNSEEEQAGKNSNVTAVVHSRNKIHGKKEKIAEVVHENRQNISKRQNKVLTTSTNSETRKETPPDDKRSLGISVQTHESSPRSNLTDGVSRGPAAGTENLEIQSELGEKRTEASESENISKTMKKNELPESPVQRLQSKKVESVEEQTLIENSEEKSDDIGNLAKPVRESAEASKLTGTKSNQKGSTNSDASELTSEDQTKARNPLALFPKVPSVADKAQHSKEHTPSTTEKDTESSAKSTGSSARVRIQPSQSVHPKLRGKNKGNDHEQPSKSSVVSLEPAPENHDDQNSRAVGAHPKLQRKPGSVNPETGSGKAQGGVTHPKLKSKSTNSGAEETSDESPSRQGNDDTRSREMVHPKPVDASKQTQNPHDDIHTDSAKTDPLTQHGIKSGETGHPKLTDTSERTQQPKGNGSTGKSSKEAKNINSKSKKENLVKDIVKKIDNASKNISDKASKSIKTVKGQTQIKVENLSKEVKNKETLKIVPAQSRREKTERVSTMVASIFIALIILVSIATIVGAVFKKLSFTRQRYGEHMPLSTEDDDDLPLYSRYRPPYETWKEMI